MNKKSQQPTESAPEFNLPDQSGQMVSLASLIAKGPVLLVFYPGDFTYVCTKQLCDYRDHLADFKDLGIQVVGISQNPTTQHAKFAEKYAFGFPLLTDAGKTVAQSYGCASVFMLGAISRAIVIVNKHGKVVYRHVEPTALTKRTAEQLLATLSELRDAGTLD